MTLLIKYTLIYGVVLLLVALGGMFSERSGIINIALEGIMVIGALAGVVVLNMMPKGTSAAVTVIVSIGASALAGLVIAISPRKKPIAVMAVFKLIVYPSKWHRTLPFAAYDHHWQGEERQAFG